MFSEVSLNFILKVSVMLSMLGPPSALKVASSIWNSDEPICGVSPVKRFSISPVPFESERKTKLLLTSIGALSSIAIILYFKLSSTWKSASNCFFYIKKVSSSILFLSDEGKESQALPSLAL